MKKVQYLLKLTFMILVEAFTATFIKFANFLRNLISKFLIRTNKKIPDTKGLIYFQSIIQIKQYFRDRTIIGVILICQGLLEYIGISPR